MKPIVIFLPSKPVPSARPRFVRRGNHVGAYDPQLAQKKWIKEQLIETVDENIRDLLPLPNTVALQVLVECRFKCPSYFSATQKRECRAGIGAHTRKPDVDNLLKFYLDCMKDIIYDDDRQIVCSAIYKRYAVEYGTLVVIREHKPLVENWIQDDFGRF